MGKSFNLKGYTKKTQDKKQEGNPSKFQGLRDSENNEYTTKTQDNIVTNKETKKAETIKTQKSNNINTKQTQDNSSVKKPEKKKAASAPKEKETQVSNNISTIQAQSSNKTNTIQTQENIRINMAFTDDNYEIIAQESEKLSIPMAAFINETVAGANIKEVEEYIAGLPIIPNKNMIPRRKGHKMKRINIRLTQEVHNILTSGAEKYNQTLTQYLNCVLNYTIKAQARNNLETI